MILGVGDTGLGGKVTVTGRGPPQSARNEFAMAAGAPARDAALVRVRVSGADDMGLMLNWVAAWRTAAR
jgi:hypothetical protein